MDLRPSRSERTLAKAVLGPRLYSIYRNTKNHLFRKRNQLVLNRLVRAQETKVVLFCGVRRSGNHAVINWFFKWLPGSRYFINDYQPRKGLIHHDNYVNATVFPVRAPKVLISFENKTIEEMDDACDPLSFVSGGRAQDVSRLIILRDPNNTFASLFTMLADRWGREEMERQVPGLVAKWISLAECCLRIDSRPRPTERLNYINFNRWLVSEAYRKSLADAHGLRGHAISNRVSHQGGGSSFDTDGVLESAGSMFQRHHRFREDPLFCDTILGNHQLQTLGKALFGDGAWSSNHETSTTDGPN